MPEGEFRVIYNSARYEDTVSFYRDGLGLELIDSWDERPEARGSVFRAGAGLIEIMAQPVREAGQWNVFSPELPSGTGIAFEVEKVDEWYRRACEKKLPVKAELADFNWGQRGFALIEPNGLVVFIYSRIAAK